MIDKYVLASNDDGDLAVRTVQATESSSVTDTTSVITATDDGKLAVRVVGSGGGDSHNLGYYETPETLRTAYPTATAGDFAIVNSTDTVWLWDADTSAWKDGDTKGQVTSVNNQTGAVTIGANDVLPSQTGYSGRVLGTDGFVAGWVEPEIVQRAVLPVASQDEEGNIYQFVGTTDANYTNGYFYECVSDGATPPVYSWSQVNVQPGSSLPSQTGNAGKFLTTDGTDASWSDTLEKHTVKNTVDTATIYSGVNLITFKGKNANNEELTFGSIGSYKQTGLQISGTLYTGSIIPSTGSVSDLGSRGVGLNRLLFRRVYAEALGTRDDYAITIPNVAGELAVKQVNTTITIAVADWNGGTTVTKTVAGITATGVVMVSPDPTDQAAYTSAGILCTAQAADSLTFTCSTTPSADIDVNVVML